MRPSHPLRHRRHRRHRAATRTAYRLDRACFAAWTASHGLDAQPARPETVGLYLTTMAPMLRVSILERRLAAIAVAYRLAGHQLDNRHPTIRDDLRGIHRAHGSARRQAAAAVELVKVMVASCVDDRLGRRAAAAADRGAAVDASFTVLGFRAEAAR